MNLNSILLNTIASQSKLKNLKTTENIFYTETLYKKIKELKISKEANHKKLPVGRGLKSNKQNFFITYIITISFLRSNTTIHVSDNKGSMINFFVAGLTGLVGKQKRQRRLAALKLILMVKEKLKFLMRTPTALHLNNITFYKRFLISKLKKLFFIQTVKSFNSIAHNGCRKKKMRRKKNRRNQIK